MINKKEMIEKFENIKEIMKDYTSICKIEGCRECPFYITVAYCQQGGAKSLCEVFDEILE